MIRMRQVAGLVMVMLAGGTASAGAAGGFAGPDDCASCHAQEHTDWRASVHARAYSPSFEAAWKKAGSAPRCLGCHTTGHRAGSATYDHKGISCEACHGPKGADHPGGAKMPMPVSSAMCLKCHVRTHQEWRVSRHGVKGIRCFDCHRAHGQGLRAGGGDKLCGSCHPKRQEDFAHASHHAAGLGCATCHYPAVPGHQDAIAGTGAARHALSVGGEVCARCHEDTVHRSGKLPGLREEVGALKRQMAAAGVTDVFALKEEARDLEWRLNRLRQGFWLGALLALVAGFGLGWLGAWLAAKKRG